MPDKWLMGQEMLRFFRRFIAKKDGTTAIEFSMLALPYIMLSLAILEISIMYASASLLEGATDSAARMIRTGQLQQSGSANPEQDFRDALCEFAVVLVDCNEMVIEVMPLASYGDFSGPTFDTDGNMISSGFDPGGSNERVLIRVAYRYAMVTPIVGPLLNGPGGATLFMSTIVMQSEPYEFGGGV